jgi:cardiolipin synthase
MTMSRQRLALLPNAISFARIALVPAWVAAANACRVDVEAGGSGDGPRRLALWILVAIGASDVVDGFLARRWGLTSHFGAVVDAVADKLCQVALVTWLAGLQRTFAAPVLPLLPLSLWIVLMLRDALLAIGCLLVRRRRGRVQVVHKLHGKATSLLLFALLLLCNANVGPGWTSPFAHFVTVLAALSALLYMRDGLRQWRGASEPIA